ncbi:MAG: hypothetical protein ACI9HJ_000005 [Ulvibacter sp.]|jgi:hypothetical protein
MKYVSILIISLFLSACGATLTVDYDSEKDFSEYTSYEFYNDIDSGLNQLDDKRIMAAIDTSFQNRGFLKTDYCRFHVNFYATEYVSASRNTIGLGVGGGGGNVGVGISGGIPIGGNVINQKLTIDIIDASLEQSLVWQVIIEGELKEKATPEQKEAYYFSEIDKALKKFPPK